MIDLIPGGRALLRFWHVALVVTVISTVVAYGLSFAQPASYSAATQVLVRARDIRFLTATGQDPNARGGLDLVQPKSVSQTLGGIATSKPVAEQVVRELELDKPSEGSRSGLG